MFDRLFNRKNRKNENTDTNSYYCPEYEENLEETAAAYYLYETYEQEDSYDYLSDDFWFF